MMIDMYLKLLNPNQTFRDVLPKLIEVFVKYYGEEYRDEITYKFQHMEMISYGYVDGDDTNLASAKDNIAEELINQFLTEIGDKNDHFKYLLFDYSNGLEFTNIIPFYSYIQYKELLATGKDNPYIKKAALKFLQRIDSRITLENMDALMNSGTFSEIDNMIEPFNRMLKSYAERVKVLKPFDDERKEMDKHRKDLQIKYYTRLVSEYAHLFPSELVEKVKNNPLSFFHRDIIYAYLGGSVELTPLLEAFSSKSNELIANNDWRKRSIMNDRMAFFKCLGFNLGDNYEDYINNPEVQKIIPDVRLVEESLDRRMELLDEFLEELYETSIEYQRNMEIISKHQLMLEDTGYSYLSYEFDGAYVQPNIVMENGRPVPFALMLLNMKASQYNKYLDVKIIHELNHVFELCLQEVDSSKALFTCGWDIIHCEVKEIEEEKDDKRRDYELFNEIVNEMIAQEITTLMHQEGVYIFNTPSNVEVRGGTAYEVMWGLIRDFFEEFKPEILASRRTRDMQILFEKVGEENFNALNNLIVEFNEKFPENVFHRMMNDKINNIDSPLVREYQEMISRSKKILEKMRSNSKRK